MNNVADAPAAYAKFPRRLRALVVDAAVVSLSFLAVALALPALPDAVGPTVWIAAVLAWLLYEPVLVSRTGGTLGHHVMNLRVQDEGAAEPIGFWRAFLRAWSKGLLGIGSFVAMVLTRRHQALHDVLTKSVVVVHDVDRARASPRACSGEPDASPGGAS
jgi:uncharacterized RDD family membrane protein YckC